MTKKPENPIQVGRFYYPKTFYEIHHHHLLTGALKYFMQQRSLSNTYEFLLLVEHVRVGEIMGVYETFIKNGAPKSLNITHLTRDQITRDLDRWMNRDMTTKAAPNPPTHRKLSPRARPVDAVIRPRKFGIHTVFDEVREEVVMNMDSDVIKPDQSAGSFWNSEVFLAMHNYRTKRRFRVWNRIENMDGAAQSKNKFDKMKQKADAIRNAKLAETAARMNCTVEELLEMEREYNS